VAGMESDDIENDDIRKIRCVFWKNGALQNLGSSAQANSVFVTRKE